MAPPPTECCICMDNTTDIVLNCGHSFCKKCIRQTLLKNPEFELKCPLCRSKTLKTTDKYLNQTLKEIEFNRGDSNNYEENYAIIHYILTYFDGWRHFGVNTYPKIPKGYNTKELSVCSISYGNHDYVYNVFLAIKNNAPEYNLFISATKQPNYHKLYKHPKNIYRGKKIRHGCVINWNFTS